MRALPFVVDTVAYLKENKKPLWSYSNCNMVHFDCGARKIQFSGCNFASADTEAGLSKVLLMSLFEFCLKQLS